MCIIKHKKVTYFSTYIIFKTFAINVNWYYNSLFMLPKLGLIEICVINIC